MTVVHFRKRHVRVAVKLLISLIAEVAKSDETDYLVDDLSIVLSVLWRCLEAAPLVENEDLPS